MDKLITKFIFILVCTISFTSLVSAGNSTSVPFTCTIWDDILDVFRTADCGSEYTGLLIYDGESKPTITKYTGTEENTFIPIINNNEVCFYHKEGTNATNLNDLKIALENAQSSVPLWKVGVSYKVNDLVSYNNLIYKVIQAHTSQAGWNPNVVPALFSFYAFQELGEVPTWKQPTGAQDAYKINDRVFFEGYIYESKINANVWSPTAYPAGWTKLGTVYVSEPNSPSNITIQTSVNNLVVPRQTNGSFSIYCTTIQDKIQIGNNTIIIEDQETKSVVYSIGGENNITATVLRDVLHDGNYTNPVNNVWVFVENNKFGANWSSDNTTWEKFKYEIKSDLPIQFYNGNNFDFYGSEAIYRLNVDDICYAGANCTYEINQVGEEYILSIYFYNKDGFIDPTILTVSFTPQSGNIYNQSRWEGNNITHLEIPDNATRYMYAGATADYVYKNNHQFNNTFSFSFWMNRVGATAFGQVARQTDASFTVANGWRIGADGAGTSLLWWALNSTGSTCSAGTSMGSSTANTWQHWLVTYNGTRYEIYRDGVNVLNANCAVNMSALVYPVDMGRIVGGYDDLIFYNEYLNSTQVSNIYNNGRFTQLSLSSITDYYSFNGNASNWSNSGTNTTALTTSGSPVTYVDELNTNNPFGSYLQAYYSFDSENTNPNWTTGKISNGLQFDATNDFVNISTNSIRTNYTELTFMGWVYIPSHKIYNALVGTDSGFITTRGMSMHVYSSGQLYWQLANGTTQTSIYTGINAVNTNQWVHLAGTFNGTHLKYFINGTEASVAGGSATAITNQVSLEGSTVHLGEYNNAFFNGIMDEVKLYNRSLSPTEIANIYSNESLGITYSALNTTGLVGEWKLNESGANWTATDSSGLGNNGALGSFQATTTAYDLTNNNNDGTFTGDAHTENGLYANSLVLDGNGDYVSVPDSSTLDGYSEMTLSLWVNPKTINWQSSSNGVSIMNKHTSYSLSVAGSGSGANAGKLYWYTYGNGLATYADYNLSDKLNEWTHLMVIYNSSKGLIYVNGILNATSTGTSSTPIPNTAQLLNLGYYSGANSWNGSIDEVMIFSKALNATEILQIYNNQSRRFKSNGTIEAQPVGLSQGVNGVNVTFNNMQTNYNTSVEARIRYWDIPNGYNVSSSNSLANGLVSYWTGDGNANDSMGLNNGTLNGNANASSLGVYNNSFGFDGNGDYISTGDIDLNSSFSIGTWVYTSALPTTSNNYPLIVKGTGAYPQYVLDLLSDGSSREYFRIFGFEGTTAKGITGATVSYVEQNKWYYVVATFDGISSWRVYVDGILRDSATSSATLTANNDNMFIGYRQGSGVYNNGLMDDVMIWNRTLSATEARELYNNGLAIWNYTNYQTINQTNVPYTIGLNNFNSQGTTIALDSRLSSNNSDGWYTPYLDGGNLTAITFPPEISFNIPPTTNGSAIEGQNWVNYSVNIPYSDTATTCLYFSNDTLYDCNTDAGSGSWAGLPFGSYKLNSTTSNGLGSASTETLNITLSADLTNPLIQFVSPTDASGTMKTGNLIVNLTGSDLNWANMTLNVYYQNGTLYYTNTTTNTQQYYSINGFQNGLFYFNATAYDTYGNTNSTETRNVTFDNEFDTFQLFVPVQNNLYNSTVPLRGFANDSAGISQLWYNVLYEGLNQNTTYISNTTFTFNTTFNISDIGSYYITVYANDTLGNMANPITRFFHVTNISQGPAGQNGTNGINGTFTDTLNTTQFYNQSNVWSLNMTWLTNIFGGIYCALTGCVMQGDIQFNNSAINNTNYVQFNTTWTDGSAEGRLQWNSAEGALEVGMPGGNVNLQIGQEQILRVTNDESFTIKNGQAVYVSSATGSNIKVKLASATTDIAHYTFGLATEDIASGHKGYITTFGVVHDLNTSLYEEGTPLYLSTNAGNWTNITPSAPNHRVFIGYVVRQSSTVGEILVNIQVGEDLANLDDILLTNPQDGQVLMFNATSGLWYNANYTAYNDTWINQTFYNSTQSDARYTQPGTCPAGYVVQNTTNGGVQCVALPSYSTEIYSGDNYTYITGQDTVNVNISKFDERYYNKSQVDNLINQVNGSIGNISVSPGVVICNYDIFGYIDTSKPNIQTYGCRSNRW